MYKNWILNQIGNAYHDIQHIHKTYFRIISVLDDMFCFWNKFGEFRYSQKTVSSSIAVIVWLFWIFFIVFIIYQLYKMLKGSSQESQKHFNELFSGLRNKNVAKAYGLFLTLRRAILVSILLFFFFNSRTYVFTRVLCIVCFQFIFMIAMIVVRPFKHIKDNMINIINEIIFMMLSSILIHYNK